MAVPAAAQRNVEVTPEQCSDHRDNNGNGLVDCDDPACRGYGFCQSVPLVEVDGEKKPLPPSSQILAGALMLVLGPALAAASSAVFLDAADQRTSSKQALEYTVGGVLTAAGAAIAIGGAVVLHKGIVRHREDVDMGLALGPTKLGLIVHF